MNRRRVKVCKFCENKDYRRCHPLINRYFLFPAGVFQYQVLPDALEHRDNPAFDFFIFFGSTNNCRQLIFEKFGLYIFGQQPFLSTGLAFRYLERCFSMLLVKSNHLMLHS